MGHVKDLTGKRFGNLVVLELTELQLKYHRGAVWKCRCDCGKICLKTSTHLQDKRNVTMSCGCKSKVKRPDSTDKYVNIVHISYKERARNVFAERLLEYFKDSPFIEELTEGVHHVLEKENENG